VKNLQRGFKPTGIFEYFNRFEELLKLKNQVKEMNDLQNLKVLENALAVRSAFKIKNTMIKLFTSKLSENENINSVYALDVIQMTHSHIMYVTFKNFITHIENDSFKCPKVKENL